MKITITATANGSLVPSTGTFPNKVHNGDFSISGNENATFVGDGVDEETSWAFDFTADPIYQFFTPPQGLASAILTLTLTPRDALITTDSVRIAGLGQITGPIPALPVNVTNTIQIDLLAQPGYTAAAILAVLAANTGKIPMLYQDDSIISAAKLELAQRPPALQYAVKFVCGKSDGKVVAPGTYFTAINVHNPTYETVKFRKKFAVALPSEKAGPVTPFLPTGLGPDQAFEIDNEDIFGHLGAAAASAATVYSYEPSLGTLPSAQGWASEFFNGVSIDTTRTPVAVLGGRLHQGPTSVAGGGSGVQWFQKAPTTTFRFSDPGTLTVDFGLVLHESTFLDTGPGYRGGWSMDVEDPDRYTVVLTLAIRPGEDEVVARLSGIYDIGSAGSTPWIPTGIMRGAVGKYRVTVEGRVARFFVGEVELGSQALGTNDGFPLYTNSMIFGDPTNQAWSTSELLGLRADYTSVSKADFVKGFAVLESDVELDVVAVYTAAGRDGQVETIHTERVTPRRRGCECPGAPPGLPDLVPVPLPGLGTDPIRFCRLVEQGPDKGKLIVRVGNQGAANAGASVTRVTFGTGTTVDLATPPIAAGAEVDVGPVAFPPSCFQPDCHFRITVDATNVVAESNEANNTVSGSCLG